LARGCAEVVEKPVENYRSCGGVGVMRVHVCGWGARALWAKKFCLAHNVFRSRDEIVEGYPVWRTDRIPLKVLERKQLRSLRFL
jgi:hypothetical protein